MPEEVEDTGIVYYSRFYELRRGAEPPPRDGPIGGDLGYLKYAIFQGDNGTFSITLATPTDDSLLRGALSTIEALRHDGRRAASDEGVGRSRGVASDHGRAPDGRTAQPAAHVRRRRRPLALGVHALGDASVCTNPLYGRGCSTGFWHAHLLAGVVREHPDDLDGAGARAPRPHRASTCCRGIGRRWCRTPRPRRIAAAILAGEDIDDPEDPRSFMRSVLREGLAPAMRTDPEVYRAFVRTFNLLLPPETLISDADIGARVLAVWNDRANRPPEPVLGPPRPELLEVLGLAA